MADVYLRDTIWSKLKPSANCFAPQLLSAFNRTDFQRKDLAAKAAEISKRPMSPQFVGSILNLEEARTHDKCLAAINAFNAMAGTEDLSDREIVLAAFKMPTLADAMSAAKLDVAALAERAGVSQEAIIYALGEIEGLEQPGPRRVPGGVAFALHKVLSEIDMKALGSLEDFATPEITTGTRLKVEGTPFSEDDLRLPLPDPLPVSWNNR